MDAVWTSLASLGARARASQPFLSTTSCPQLSTPKLSSPQNLKTTRSKRDLLGAGGQARAFRCTGRFDRREVAVKETSICDNNEEQFLSKIRAKLCEAARHATLPPHRNTVGYYGVEVTTFGPSDEMPRLLETIEENKENLGPVQDKVPTEIKTPRPPRRGSNDDDGVEVDAFFLPTSTHSKDDENELEGKEGSAPTGTGSPPTVIPNNHSVLSCSPKTFTSEDVKKFTYNGYVSIILECCNHGTFEKLLQKEDSTESLDDLLVLYLDVLSGTMHVHACNIIHGDLTAANVFLHKLNTSGGMTKVAKVGDFGNSRIEGQEEKLHGLDKYCDVSFPPPGFWKLISFLTILFVFAIHIHSLGTLLNEVLTRDVEFEWSCFPSSPAEWIKTYDLTHWKFAEAAHQLIKRMPSSPTLSVPPWKRSKTKSFRGLLNFMEAEGKDRHE